MHVTYGPYEPRHGLLVTWNFSLSWMNEKTVDACHLRAIWATAWPTDDMKFSRSWMNEKTVDACHVRAVGRKPSLDLGRKFAAWTLDQKPGWTCRHQSLTLPISGKVESGRIQGKAWQASIYVVRSTHWEGNFQRIWVLSKIFTKLQKNLWAFPLRKMYK